MGGGDNNKRPHKRHQEIDATRRQNDRRTWQWRAQECRSPLFGLRTNRANETGMGGNVGGVCAQE